MRTRYIAIIVTILASIITGCQKLVEVSPPRNTLSNEAVFTDTSNVKSAILGLYAGLKLTNTFQWSLSVLNGLYADEITGISYQIFLNSALTPSEPSLADIWGDSYATIYRANALIEGVKNSTAIPQALKQQAMGEALFFRAFCHFNLVNLFDSIPLMLTTDVSANSVAPQASKSAVYAQMIDDLKAAAGALPADYNISSNERTRVNKYAANALLARVYLYNNDWSNAEAQASSLITAASLFSMPDLSSVFLNTSREAILQFDRKPQTYTTIASQFVPVSGVMPSYIITPQLLGAFEAGDLRKTQWIAVSAGYSYPAKYKTTPAGNNGIEYLTALRLAEQYLIRAEARARLNNTDGAKEDLNVVRKRAGLGNTASTDQPSLLTSILQERRVELFCEWGNRFLDLKRTGQANAVLGAIKAGWKTTAVTYPVPAIEIGKNTNLNQNKGYQ